jgi:DNA processing protein
MLRKKHEIKILKKSDLDFPQKLKELKKCPEQIYVMGNEKILNDYMISVVGARDCSFESIKIAKEISEGISKLNKIIVSGFAKGIDSVAHNESVKNNSKTVAVIGSGLERIYPKQNSYLIDSIIENDGAIISEHSPSESPQRYYFSLRNRIIAALSNVLVVIQAREKSGSLITVKYAEELMRPILVVPGAVEDCGYTGSNLLIKKGNRSVNSFKDVYDFLAENESLEIIYTNPVIPTELLDVYNAISENGNSVNDIYIKTNLNINDIQYKLVLLEMRGLIQKGIDGLFYTNRRVTRF